MALTEMQNIDAVYVTDAAPNREDGEKIPIFTVTATAIETDGRPDTENAEEPLPITTTGRDTMMDAGQNAIPVQEKTNASTETTEVTEMAGIEALENVDKMLSQTTTKKDIETDVGQNAIPVQEKTNASTETIEVTEMAGIEALESVEETIDKIQGIPVLFRYIKGSTHCRQQYLNLEYTLEITDFSHIASYTLRNFNIQVSHFDPTASLHTVPVPNP